MALSKAKELVSSNTVVVFSKSYCPYCAQVKTLLSQLGANYKAVELDKESDGGAIQSALEEWTGQRTVPNVFINGKHMGGCSDVTTKHNEGQLVPLLTEAGVGRVPVRHISSNAAKGNQKFIQKVIALNAGRSAAKLAGLVPANLQLHSNRLEHMG